MASPWLMMAGPVSSAFSSLMGAFFNFTGGAQAYSYQADIAGYQQQLYNQQAEYYNWLGQAQAKGAEYNALIAERQAEISRMVGEFNATVYEADKVAVEANTKYEAYQLRKAGDALLSTQQARYASSGVVPGGGSALEVMMDTADDVQLEMAVSRYSGEVQSAKLQNLANLSRWSGENNAVASEMQAVIDRNLATQYLYAGRAQAAAATYSGAIAGLQGAIADTRRTAGFLTGASQLLGAGSSLLAGYGAMQRAR
uniref:Uncharacterized protein n=3 Tax=viral metagenome TaxID=1070528 RepID=A0A6H1ZDY7_9ZZZZ